MKKPYFILLATLVLLTACTGTTPERTTPNQAVPNPANPEETSSEGLEGSEGLESQALNSRSPLGTNLSGVSPFGNDHAFIDAFKNAWEWQVFEGVAPIGANQLDSNGWVKSLQAGQTAYTLMFNAVNGLYPSGSYILLYDGEGTLEVGGDATFASEGVKTGNTTRRIVTVKPVKNNPATPDTEDVGIYLQISATNPSNYIRNIRLIMPGGTCGTNAFFWAASASRCENGDYVAFEKNYQSLVFHPNYLRRLRNYSTIRFMTWQETNGSIQKTWANRPKVSDAQWSTKDGVPLEIMIDLVNRLDIDPWFNMPHAADDTYMREFAKLVKQKLEAGRKVYVEYSNEIWLDRPEGTNDDAQHDYAVAEGKRLGLVSSSECSSVGAETCNNLYWQRFQSKRSLEMFNLWQQNFGSSNLVRVLASTTLVNGGTRELLRYQNAYTKTDAVAYAPYFGDLIFDEAGEAFIKGFTVEGYIARLRGELLTNTRNDMREQKDVIASFGKKIPLVAYEGGQILVQERSDKDPQVEKFFDDVNRAPAMKQVYLDYLNMWKAEGGQLYNHFVNSGSWSGFGRWGALEYLWQPRSSAPKFDALQTFIEQNPRWW
ncbi:MAG: hypothetical protein ACRCYY_14620 [Trueperaceae bacterium]